jgi:hypothetical protein
MAHTSCWYLSAQEFLDVALLFLHVAVKNDKFNLQFIVYVGPETDERYQVYVGSGTDERYKVNIGSETDERYKVYVGSETDERYIIKSM